MSEVPLSSVIKRTVGGGTPDRGNGEFWDGQIPWATVKDFKEGSYKMAATKESISEKGLKFSASNLVPAGTPIICTRMAVGRIARSTSPVAINQDLRALFVHDAFDTDYVVWAIDSIRNRIENLSVGSTVKGISVDQLLSFEILGPPKLEQTKIAEVLSTVDRAIEQTEALIAKQQRIKTGLMQDLLTRGIDEDGNLRSEETHEFKDSPLGRIPVEWWVSSVEAEFSLSTGFTLGEHRRPHKNRHPYLRVANVQRERVVLDEVFELEAKHAEVLGRSLEENDLLIVEGHASANEIGRCARVPSEAVAMTFQNHLFRLRCRRLHSRFALAWLNSEWVRAHWRRLSGTSSGLNTINSTVLKAVPVLMPPVQEQGRIAEILDAHDARIHAEEACHDKLKLQKTALMQDLLTGEKRVMPLLEAEQTTGSAS